MLKVNCEQELFMNICRLARSRHVNVNNKWQNLSEYRRALFARLHNLKSQHGARNRLYRLISSNIISATLDGTSFKTTILIVDGVG